MKIHAVGALVLFYNGQAAMFRREDFDGNGCDLPFGKLEDGEKPKETARRECVEEIGIEVQLCKVEPYVGKIKDRTCITYLAKPKTIIAPTHSHEGSLFIGDPDLLKSGKYAEYNTKMLEYFKEYLIHGCAE